MYQEKVNMEQGIRPIGEQFTDRSFLMSQTTKSGKNEQTEIMKNQWRNFIMAFFQSAVGTLQTLVVALGAGHDALGTFVPKFAELNDDVLFGEVWSREKQLSLRDRSIVTVTALMAQGLTDSSFKYHLETAKKNGVTGEEMAEILTHAAFYAGWSKAWAAFRMAKEVYAE